MLQDQRKRELALRGSNNSINFHYFLTLALLSIWYLWARRNFPQNCLLLKSKLNFLVSTLMGAPIYNPIYY